jgi:type IV secretory pathway TrbL component
LPLGSAGPGAQGAAEKLRAATAGSWARAGLHAALAAERQEETHMGDLHVIDQFMQTFIRYIDSGFGLLNGDVAFLTTTLIGIDITLAGLFWAMDGEANIFGRLINKVLYVGALRLSSIISCWPTSSTAHSRLSGSKRPPTA